MVKVIEHHTDLLQAVVKSFGFFTANLPFAVSTLIVCLIGAIFCNLMSSVGAAIVYIPAVIFEVR